MKPSIEVREASCCKRTLVLSRVTSTAQVGDAKRASSSNMTVPLKKRSQTPGSLCVKGNTPLWSAGGIPCGWTDVCGFVEPPNSSSECLVRKHGAFEINHEDFGALPKRSNSPPPTHETWIHLSHVSASLVQRDGDLEMIMPDREPSNEGDALTEVTMHFLSSFRTTKQ